jgi:hypothetical protein
MVPLYSHTNDNVDIVDQIALEEQVSDEVMVFSILCYIMSNKEAIIQNEDISILSPLYLPNLLNRSRNGYFQREVEKARSYLQKKSVILAPFCVSNHWPLLVIVKQPPGEPSKSPTDTGYSTDDVILYVVLVADSIDSYQDYKLHINALTSLLEAIHTEPVSGENMSVDNTMKKSVAFTLKKCKKISQQVSNDGQNKGNDCAFHCLLNMNMFITIHSAICDKVDVEDSEDIVINLGFYLKNDAGLGLLYDRIERYQKAYVQKQDILNTRTRLADFMKLLRLRACNSVIDANVVTPPVATSNALTISRDASLLSYRRNVVQETIERITDQGHGYTTPTTSSTALMARKQSVFVLTVSGADGMRISSTNKDPHSLLESHGFYNVANVIQYNRLPVHSQYEGPWTTMIKDWLTDSERITLNIIQSVNVICKYRVIRRSQLVTEARPKTFTEIGIFLDGIQIPSYVVLQFDFDSDHSCIYDHDVRVERFRVANQFYAAVMLSALVQYLQCSQGDVKLLLMNINPVHVNDKEEYLADNASEPIERAIIEEVGFTLCGDDWVYEICQNVRGVARRKGGRLRKRQRDNDIRQRVHEQDSDDESDFMNGPDHLWRVQQKFSDFFRKYMEKDKHFDNLKDEEALGDAAYGDDGNDDDHSSPDSQSYSDAYSAEDYEDLEKARRGVNEEGQTDHAPKRRKTIADPKGMDISSLKGLLSIEQILQYVKQMLDSNRLAEVL